MDEALREYRLQIEAEARQEYLQHNPVYKECGYVNFVSKSKGRKKNGEQRLRRNWKEVELFRYNTGWHYPQNFPFDDYATELLGGRTDVETLEKEMKEVCKPTGGRGITNELQFSLTIKKGMRRPKGLQRFK